MDRLVLILADMLRSALTWEQNQGPPPQCGYEDTLTNMPPDIYTDDIGNHRGGKRYDDHKNCSTDEPQDDLRGPQGAES